MRFHFLHYKFAEKKPHRGLESPDYKVNANKYRRLDSGSRIFQEEFGGKKVSSFPNIPQPGKKMSCSTSKTNQLISTYVFYELIQTTVMCTQFQHIAIPHGVL